MRVGTIVRGAVERCLFSRPASRTHLTEQWAWRAQDYFETRNGMAGADYSSKFSAWLAHGCISPRFVHAEAQRYERERVKNKSTYWLTFELEWRDFFRCDLASPHKAAGARRGGLTAGVGCGPAQVPLREARRPDLQGRGHRAPPVGLARRGRGL
jgi:hypothetical protein